MSTKRFWLFAAMLLVFAEGSRASAAGSGHSAPMPGMVKLGSLEFTEAQLLMLMVYGFLLAVMLRRRIVG
ncbi:MAG: hypothetical protein MUF01_09690 [Bryobacterales bacterium]|jgi:hypothetical protein|nr:hypothetical protein [Bryobacterales bacterium]